MLVVIVNALGFFALIAGLIPCVNPLIYAFAILCPWLAPVLGSLGPFVRWFFVLLAALLCVCCCVK